MSYHRRPRVVRQLAGDTAHGPSWYTSMGGIVSRPPGRRILRRMPPLGSLGEDPPDPNTLATPTLPPFDPSGQWQDAVLTQLRAGVDTLKRAELQKWLQILATVSIPLSAAIWKMIFKRGVSDSGV